jgi:hypothetical protein
MLYLYLGTDRKKAHDAMDAAIKKLAKGKTRVHLSDANSLADLDAALSGPGLFGEPRVIILDGIFADQELSERVLANAASMKESDDTFFIFEEKLLAAPKRALGKYAETTETFDAAKKAPDNAIFKLRFALEKCDKKTLWVGLMHEYAKGAAPEQVHGFLFWAAKQMVLGGRTEASLRRARTVLARLAELPHESRRKGFELEYALERFVLSEV